MLTAFVLFNVFDTDGDRIKPYITYTKDSGRSINEKNPRNLTIPLLQAEEISSIPEDFKNNGNYIGVVALSAMYIQKRRETNELYGVATQRSPENMLRAIKELTDKTTSENFKFFGLTQNAKIGSNKRRDFVQKKEALTTICISQSPLCIYNMSAKVSCIVFPLS